MTGEKAIELVESAFDAWEEQYSVGDAWSEEHEAKDMAIKALEKETREGRWEKTGGLFPDDRRIKCSECGYDADGLRDFEKAKFCPECGIKLQQKRKFEIHSADDFVKAVRTIMKESGQE